MESDKNSHTVVWGTVIVILGYIDFDQNDAKGKLDYLAAELNIFQNSIANAWYICFPLS